MDAQDNKIALISSADSNYFPLLQEWIHSIRRFPQSKDMDICIFDVGMTGEQHEIIKSKVQNIIKPGWPKQISAERIKGNEFYKACVNRPFLNEFFKGYNFYFWMDADTWVQDWRAVEMFLKGAEKKRLAVTSTIDRCYSKFLKIKWLGPIPYQIRSFYMGNTRRAYDVATAKKMFDKPLSCAGAFCLHKDAPHWKAWQETILKTLEKGNVFTAEQLSMGMVVYLQGHAAEILPSYMQWHCETYPLWDEERSVFVEPYVPNEPLGIIHLTGHDQMRKDRSTTKEFETMDGGKIEYTYRYPHYDGEKSEEASWLPTKKAA